MKILYTCFLFFSCSFISTYAQPEKIKAKITERTEEQISAEQEDASSWLENQVSLDPAWLTRGNIVLGYERLITDYITVRAHIGASFKDNLDGVFYDGIIDQGLKVQSVSPRLSYGGEVRYYGNEAASFSGYVTGFGVFRRNYSYQGYFFNGFSQFLNDTYNTSGTDFYFRYGGYYTLFENKSFKSAIEFGLCAGMSFNKFYTLTNSYDPNSFELIYSTETETSIQYLIQPNIAINFAF